MSCFRDFNIHCHRERYIGKPPSLVFIAFEGAFLFEKYLEVALPDFYCVVVVYLILTVGRRHFICMHIAYTFDAPIFANDDIEGKRNKGRKW